MRGMGGGGGRGGGDRLFLEAITRYSSGLKITQH